MRKFYFIAVLFVLFATMASAQQVKRTVTPSRSGVKDVKERGKKTSLHFTDMHSPSIVYGSAKSAKAANDGTDEVITDTPQGELKLYDRKCMTYYVDWGSVYEEEIMGYASEIVYADDGKTVYWKNPFGSITTDSWLKGEKTSDNTIKFTLPQPIYKETYEGVTTTYYAYKLFLNESEDNYVIDPTGTDTDVELTIKGDSLFQNDTDGNSILGLSSIDGEWTGFGDYSTRLAEVKDSPVTPPSGLELGYYSFKYTDIYGCSQTAMVKAGFSGNDVYLTDLPSQGEGTFLKGTIADGKAVFKDRQYVGRHKGYNVVSYLMTVITKENIDEETGETYISMTPANTDLVFDYDETKKSFGSDAEFVLNAGKNDVFYVEYYKAPELNAVHDVAATPRDPEIYKWVKYDDSVGAGYVIIYMYAEDTGGNALPSEKLYYNIYLDNDKFTFTTDTYKYIGEEMTDIPYDFTDKWDIGVDGIEHSVFFYRTDYEKLGVQLVYTGGGETSKSNIVYSDGTTSGIDSPAHSGGTHGTVKETVYTDITGRRVSRPGKGVYIKIVKLSDGTVRTSKVFVGK